VDIELLQQPATDRLARTAPDSTLYGRATAALPLIATIVLICCTKSSLSVVVIRSSSGSSLATSGRTPGWVERAHVGLLPSEVFSDLNLLGDGVDAHRHALVRARLELHHRHFLGQQEDQRLGRPPDRGLLVTVERDAVHLDLLAPHRHLDLTDLADDAPPHQDLLGGHPSGADP